MANEIQQVDLALDMGPKFCKSKYTPSQCYFNGARGVLTFNILDPYLVPNPLIKFQWPCWCYLVGNLNFITQALNQ